MVINFSRRKEKKERSTSLHQKVVPPAIVQRVSFETKNEFCNGILSERELWRYYFMSFQRNLEPWKSDDAGKNCLFDSSHFQLDIYIGQ